LLATLAPLLRGPQNRQVAPTADLYPSRVPSARSFKAVSDALLAQLPDDAVIVGLEVSADQSFVTLWTTTPRSVIGRRGTIAETLREAVADVVGTAVHFSVELAEGDITDAPAGQGFPSVPQPPTAPLPRIPRLPVSPGDRRGTIVPPEW
jgi:hypothetical protein